jgi:transcriptional regulator with XRE-family HTH domain
MIQVQDPAGVSICQRFRKTRLDNKITQEEFAKYLLVNVSYIKAVESKRFTPSFTVMKRWKKRFRVSYDWIIEG